MDKINNFSIQVKHLLAGKKARMTLYIIGVLWIAVIMQVAMNQFVYKDNSILEAFVSTNPDASSFELEMAADYGSGYLSEADKEELIIYIAKEMGLQLDQDITVNRKDGSSEVYTSKVSKNAETTIKIVSMEQKDSEGLTENKHYLFVRLKLLKNLESILNYRALLENVFDGLNAKNIQTTMQLNSNYRGKLSLEEMNAIADGIIKDLQGTVAYANRKEDLFTVYAYSGLLKEYITSGGTKINIHVAINYDETTDKTNVYLGTPVINEGY